jgi:hypothetical protein|tara:strand:- start:80 stop:475 length:396 start_codon:yes stop_codon:yes gene_type:complete
MRFKEFINEQRENSLEHDVAAAIPATYVIPKLQNNDAYSQYRFGVAVASARGAKARANDNLPSMEPSSAWGENQIIVSYDPEVEAVIDLALKTVGLKSGDKKLISTITSDEAKDVSTTSPLPAKKKNRYGV